jgi:hypothetical protein
VFEPRHVRVVVVDRELGVLASHPILCGLTVVDFDPLSAMAGFQGWGILIFLHLIIFELL